MIEQVKAKKAIKTAASRLNSQDSAKNSSSKISSFERSLRQILPRSTEKTVSEEQLFSATISNRLSNIVDPSVAAKYQERLSQISKDMRKSSNNGDFSYEKAALKSLKAIAKQENLSEETANAVYSQAFAASQLDNIKDALYDSKSNIGDPTVATANISKALKKANKILVAIENGLTYNSRPLSLAKDTGRTVPALSNIGDPTKIVA